MSPWLFMSATVAVLERAAQPCDKFSRVDPDPATSNARYKIYNIGNQKPVALIHFTAGIEKALGKKAIQNLQPLLAGDVAANYADVSDLKRDTGFEFIHPCVRRPGKLDKLVFGLRKPIANCRTEAFLDSSEYL